MENDILTVNVTNRTIGMNDIIMIKINCLLYI